MAPHPLDADCHHPLEDWIGRPVVRKLLGWLAAPRVGRPTLLEEIVATYADPAVSRWQRFKFALPHRLIRRIKGATSDAAFRERIAEHRSTLRGLVNTCRSVAEFGLTVPQRFVAPLFIVWNFTNRCNLKCQHCYQDADAAGRPAELTRDEKLDLVDQAADAAVAMIAFAGGEPTVSPDLLPVLRRCQRYGLHTTIATNGTTMTRSLAERVRDAGVRYVEISLDSTDPARHDAFRGVPGMWARSVAGMKHVVGADGLRLGVAMCVHQGNLHEVEPMLRFAREIGAGCFAHFNFIPVGRGTEMAGEDLTPTQRDELLGLLNDWMQRGEIGVISTAPQLGRLALCGAPIGDGRMSCSHAGSGSGAKARVVAKYLGGCGAGRTYVCAEPDGDITPCVYLPGRVMGNLRERPFADICRDNAFGELLCDRTRRTGHCAACGFRNYCGGCRARADAYFGDLGGPDPGCTFNDVAWETVAGRASEAAPLSV